MEIHNFGEKTMNLAVRYSEIGTLYLNQGIFNKSFEYYNKCFNIQVEIAGPDSVEVANTYNIFGSFYLKQG